VWGPVDSVCSTAFKRTKVEKLAGPDSMVIVIK